MLSECCIVTSASVPIAAASTAQTAPPTFNIRSNRFNRINPILNPSYTAIKPASRPRRSSTSIVPMAGIFGEGKKEKLERLKRESAIIEFDRKQAEELLQYQKKMTTEFAKNGVSDLFDGPLKSLVVKQQLEKASFLVRLESGLIDLGDLEAHRVAADSAKAGVESHSLPAAVLGKISRVIENIIPK